MKFDTAEKILGFSVKRLSNNYPMAILLDFYRFLVYLFYFSGKAKNLIVGQPLRGCPTII
jgi:hypothetical protein